ncbi:MAG: hypothetical protein IKP86_06615 [Anaerolineaceae bacterium]|nr:hypothetical protein [Anaerolineaceae bacterium]
MKRISIFILVMMLLLGTVCAVSAEVKVGDIITLGHYEQDNDLKNGTEPIEWEVLAVEDGRALVISRFALDVKPYNEINTTDITWETCTLRNWLNTYFYNTAFNGDETSRILTVTNENPGNLIWGTEDEKPTTDRIFSLNYLEVEKYIDVRGGDCLPTAYAKANGAKEFEEDGKLSTRWWSRSREKNWNQDRTANAVIVGYQGYGVHGRCTFVTFIDNTAAVRPAFWMDLKETEKPEEASEGIPTNVKTGDSITFGHYEQDNDLNNGTEPIEWVVLAVEDGRALVLSLYGLDVKPYNEKFTEISWNAGTLKKWINGDFLNGAFSESEQELIARLKTVNAGTTEYSFGTAKDTETDRIFLLSTDEIGKYIPANADRQCKPTAYASANGNGYVEDENGYSWWWLRTPGETESASIVYSDGSIYEDTMDVSNTGVIRPAFWLILNETTEPTADEETEKTEKTPKGIPTDVKAGDIVTFGHFEQDNNLNNGPEPIEWQVLSVQNNHALLLSRYALTRQHYNSKNAEVTWETCSLREWLNEDFFSSAFKTPEQYQILQVTNKNSADSLSSHVIPAGNDTEDYVFLLSVDELTLYLSSGQDIKLCKPTDYAEKYSNSYIDWHLRSSSYKADSYYLSRCINYKGQLTFCNVPQSSTGVRPAIWVDLNVSSAEIEEETINPGEEKKGIPADVKVGDIFTYGSYEQDNDTTNGTEAIEWQVLAVENGRILVISHYGLEARPYNYSNSNMNWGTCTLRAWLNGDFYTDAFSSTERTQILQVTNKNSNTPGSKLAAGGDTKDRIFLLSTDEAKQYFSTDSARICQATEYTRAKTGISDEMNFWWLRSLGTYQYSALGVESDGSIEKTGSNVDVTYGMVRPVMWLKADDAKSTQRPPATLDPFSESFAESVRVGDTIKFGHYEQDNNKYNGTEPIEWRVLAVEDGRALVISKYSLDWKIYHSQRMKNVTWQISWLRSWVNGTFYNTAFSEKEMSRILQVTNENPDNPEYGTDGGDPTLDRIFVLSADEAYKYFSTDEDRKCSETDYAKAQVPYDFSHYGVWWLRTPGKVLTNIDYSLNTVVWLGIIHIDGFGVYPNSGFFVRPAFWLDLDGTSVQVQEQDGQYLSGCSMKSHLSVGDHAEVRIQVGLKMRKDPAGKETGVQAFPGRDVKIIGGPECVNGVVWWEIEFLGYTGWSMEGKDGTYYLGKTAVPIKTEPDPAETLSSSKLKIGDTVEIVNTSGLQMLQKPNGNSIGVQAFPGKTAKITDGPKVENGIVWWEIDFLGYRGWCMEGKNGTTWLRNVGDKPEATDPSGAAPAAEASASESEIPASGAYANTKLKIGDTVEIVNTTGLQMFFTANGKAMAGQSAFPGKTAKVTDGPVVVNGVIWWEIDFLGYRGWVTEFVPPRTYYLSKVN